MNQMGSPKLPTKTPPPITLWTGDIAYIALKEE